MSFNNCKLPVTQRSPRNDHLRPKASHRYETHKADIYNKINWNKKTNTCRWPDYYWSYNTDNPYPSYPTLNKIRHCLNYRRYGPYIPCYSYFEPPSIEQFTPGLQDTPAPHKDNKYIKPLPIKTNVGLSPEHKKVFGNTQLSEITKTEIIEKKPSIYSPPILPIPTYYDVYKILEKKWEVYFKSRLRIKNSNKGNKVESEEKGNKITRIDFLPKKIKESSVAVG